jgi:hypothetical protein
MTLQLALDAPGPCTPSPSWKPWPPPTDTQQRFGKDVTQAAAQRHRTGHPAGAVDPFLPRASSDPATAPHSVTVYPAASSRRPPTPGLFFTRHPIPKQPDRPPRAATE